MPGTTTNLALPYPLLTDAADIEAAVRPLADAIDAQLVHVGDLKMTARSSAPSGWLLCDGAAINRTTYAKLFTAISTTYGAGNGTTTFNLPDLRGRAPVGAGTGSGLSAKTLGAKIGTEPSNMPSHNHGGGDHVHGSHAHTPPATIDGGSSYNVSGAVEAGNTSSSGVVISTQGSGSATDGNVPPSTVVNFLIKV